MNESAVVHLRAATSGGWTDESERALVGVTGAREAARVTIHIIPPHAPKMSRVSTTDEAGAQRFKVRVYGARRGEM
uniref:Uncharacterized protein n=1 Tax=Globodera rostochiensis TaxID=31243 RepID=A0A914I7A1_GLORO